MSTDWHETATLIGIIATVLGSVLVSIVTGMLNRRDPVPTVANMASVTAGVGGALLEKRSADDLATAILQLGETIRETYEHMARERDEIEEGRKRQWEGALDEITKVRRALEELIYRRDRSPS